MYGYTGKILRVNLSERSVSVDEPDERFYRTYWGGSGFIAYFLLKEVAPGIDPLGPENRLIFATGPVTGVSVAGSGRNSIGAKSPLTNAFGESEVGGYWGAELKRAGYDALIVEGQASSPVYILIDADKVSILPADHLWGKLTGEAQRLIEAETGLARVRTAMIGPGGERLVRYACIANDLTHFAGRCGLGAVMGSKRLKAVAVTGGRAAEVADRQRVMEQAKWFAENYDKSVFSYLVDLGTAADIRALSIMQGLPTHNFQKGSFKGTPQISGETMRDTILVSSHNCFACPVSCKRNVEVRGDFEVNPIYGGPEYETLASFGSNCGVSDLRVIAKCNELCSSYTLDSISTGTVISFAMECFEHGLLAEEDTGGLRLHFGNGDAVVRLVEMIANRVGLGDLLAEGVRAAADRIGGGADRYAMHVKGQGIPMHGPRLKQGLGLGYAVSPTGAEHITNLHDTGYMRPGPLFDALHSLGIPEPLPPSNLAPEKVRMYKHQLTWRYFINCLVMCSHVVLTRFPDRILEIVEGVTGWKTTVYEFMQAGRRCATMARAFNVREGLRRKDDWLPERFFTPFTEGPLRGVAIDRDRLHSAIGCYYGMMGWDEQGIPTEATLHDLDLGWVVDQVPR